MLSGHPWIETAATAMVATAAAVTGLTLQPGPEAGVPSPETVSIAPGALSFEPVGQYASGGTEIDPDEREVAFDRPVEMMKYQVSYGEYMRCVAAARCERPETKQTDPQAPVTGVSFLDATAYADWLSAETRVNWRLPTAEEWAHAAAERFAGEVFSRADDPANPAVAWLRRYQEEVLLDRQPDPVAHPRGYFGPNSKGIHDIGGNVWEWTTACYTRTEFDAANGPAMREYENCGIRVAEGIHRAYMTSFLRDGKSGGCAVGTPPDHLGIRLVKDQPGLPVLSPLVEATRKALSL